MFELILVIAIIVVVARFSYTALVGNVGTADLGGTTGKIVALLREAQTRSLAQSSSTTWGVRFSNVTSTAAFYALFGGASYNTTTLRGYYRLPSTVAYVSSSLAQGSTTDITFNQITGAASASSSIRIYSLRNTSKSSTISVASSGAVSF